MKTLLFNSLSSLRIRLYCQQSLMPSFPSGRMWWELTVDVRIKKISYGQQFQILSFLQVFGASWQFQLSVLHWREEMLIKNEPPLINCLFYLLISSRLAVSDSIYFYRSLVLAVSWCRFYIEEGVWSMISTLIGQPDHEHLWWSLTTGPIWTAPTIQTVDSRAMIALL